MLGVAVSTLPQQVIFGLGLGAIYGLVAIGYSLIYRSMGLLSFVHAQYVMLGSVFGYTALVRLHLPLWAAILPVGLATAAVSLAVDQVGLRPIRHRRGTEMAMILATVGWGIVVVEVARRGYGSDALSLRSGARQPLHVLGVEIRWDTLGALATGAVLVIALTVFLRTTRTGRAVRAVGESATIARLMGINVERIFGVSAAISGLLGGVAGLLVGYLFVAGTSTGVIGLKSLAAAVVGGFGNLPGALVGGLLLGVLDNLVAVDLSSNWRDAIVFGLIVAVLLARPSGLFGRSALSVHDASTASSVVEPPRPGRSRRAWTWTAAIWAFRAAAVAGLYLLGPLYDGHFVLSFLIDAGIFGLAALGLQHMVGDAGILNLGQAAFFGLGAYGGVWTLQHWHWTTLPAFGAAIVVALCGALLMAPLLRLRGVYFVMASFAFGAMMFEVFGQLVSVTGGDNGLFLIPSPKVFGHVATSARDAWFLVLTTALVCWALFAALARTGYGLSLNAVRDSERGARAAGINVARMHIFAVCLGVVPAALAGVLYAQIHGIVQSTNFDYDQSVTLITMVILGGLLSRWGAFAGALLVNYLAIYGQFLKEYRLLAYGLIIVVLMIVLPGGLAALAAMLRREAARLGALARDAAA